MGQLRGHVLSKEHKRVIATCIRRAEVQMDKACC
jgi:hypothetical protein